MRIVENTSERLVLKGTPGSARWMAFATILAVVFMAGSGWFAWVCVSEMDSYLPLIPLGIGFLMGGALFLMGLLTLVVGRMQLVFNRITGDGQYEVHSPIVDVGKPCSFRLDDIDSVTLERHEEQRPYNDHRGSFPAKVCRARLRIRRPRRAIVLDVTENGQDHRVTSVAEQVAGWLDLEVTNQG